MGAFASAATHPLGPHIDHLRAVHHTPGRNWPPPPRPRRGCSAAGRSTWVLSHLRQRTRWGRTSITCEPRLRTCRRRPYRHRRKVSPHPRRGQTSWPSVRACSAASAVRTTIIGCSGAHDPPAWSITSWPGRGQLVLLSEESSPSPKPANTISDRPEQTKF